MTSRDAVARGGRPAAPTMQGAPRVAPRYAGFARVYDLLVGDSAHAILRRGVMDCLRRFAPGWRSLADVGCGTGRLLASLSTPGTRLYGVDASPAMLAVAARRVDPSTTRLLRQDLAGLALPHRVDAIVVVNETLNYLPSDPDLGRAFAAVARNLKRPGVLVFDYRRRTPGLRAMRGTVRESVELPHERIVFAATYDTGAGRTRVDITVRPRDPARAAVRETHRQRWLDSDKVRRQLSATGFDVANERPVIGGGDPAWRQVCATLH